MPQFSVIIPTIGRTYLQESVQSVLDQGFEDLEILVCVDGPHSLPALPNDPRIRVLERPVSGGAGAARNTGLDAATGEVVVFVDDDDRSLPGSLHAIARATDRAPIVLSWRDYFDDETGERWAGRRRRLEGNIESMVLTEPIPHLGTSAIRRDIIEFFDETLQTTEDVEWWLRQCQRGSVTTIPHVVYLMRLHPGERRSRTSPAKLASRLQILAKHPDWFDAHPDAASYHWKRAGGMAMQVGEPATARRAFRRSLRYRPTLKGLYHLGRSYLP